MGTIVLDEQRTVLLDLEDMMEVQLILQRLEMALKATADQMVTLGRKQALPSQRHPKRSKSWKEQFPALKRKVKAG